MAAEAEVVKVTDWFPSIRSTDAAKSIQALWEISPATVRSSTAPHSMKE
jgi:hypothetical protein